ncbi:MFS transporter [Ligilactobacillus murinus]|uniref:MFS transporter n=1 Tax=Ligilactobacillus murinus TaxID=1622 RepID=A0AAD0KZA3_9LACO|nr:MFS transporter [Ligilactobacillus murinus]AWZ39072.1 hypothetical protein CPS94_09120 [Ligilactobacillus murinus]AWZ40042.1 hypothetical protein CPQ89_02790 [Ligilactobacillus murinus]
MSGKNRLIFSKTISFAGTTLFNSILSIWIIEVFNSSKILGNINGYVGIAAIICNLLGGIFADSRYLMNLLLISDGVACLICFFVVGMGLVDDLLWIYILVFILNANSYLSSPLFKTLVHYVVRKDEIVKYNTNLSFLVQLITVLFPPVSTTLYAVKLLSMNNVVVLNGLSYLLSFLVLLSFLRKKDSGKGKISFNYLTAINYLKSDSEMFVLVVTGGLLNAFLAGFNIYVPIFTTKIINNVAIYGYIMTLEAFGGILGIISMKYVKMLNSILLERYLFIISSCLLILLSYYGNLLVIALFTIILTFCLARYNITVQSVIQQDVPQKIIGRIFSLFFLIVNIGSTMGSFIFGYLFSLNNNKPLLLVATGFVVIDLLWIFISRKI